MNEEKSVTIKLSYRQYRVARFALTLMSDMAKTQANEAAQDKRNIRYKPGDCDSFMRDSDDADAMLKWMHSLFAEPQVVERRKITDFAIGDIFFHTASGGHFVCHAVKKHDYDGNLRLIAEVEPQL